jgi:two-component system, chemotaxis family, chemotaxis protein CheY
MSGSENIDSETMAAAPSPLVMVIDDDDAIRDALKDLLAEAGFATVSAKHGLDALHVLNELEAPPTLIFLDLMMPVMDGWTFCEIRRRNGRLREIPVVALSALPITESNRPDGINAFLAKPIDVNDLTWIALRLTGRKNLVFPAEQRQRPQTSTVC